MTCKQWLRRLFKRQPIKPITMNDVEPAKPDPMLQAANANRRAELDLAVEMVRQRSWEIHHKLAGDVLEHVRGKR